MSPRMDACINAHSHKSEQDKKRDWHADSLPQWRDRKASEKHQHGHYATLYARNSPSVTPYNGGLGTPSNARYTYISPR